jgi:hypothetical protein
MQALPGFSDCLQMDGHAMPIAVEQSKASLSKQHKQQQQKQQQLAGTLTGWWQRHFRGSICVQVGKCNVLFVASSRINKQQQQQEQQQHAGTACLGGG